MTFMYEIPPIESYLFFCFPLANVNPDQNRQNRNILHPYTSVGYNKFEMPFNYEVAKNFKCYYEGFFGFRDGFLDSVFWRLTYSKIFNFFQSLLPSNCRKFNTLRIQNKMRKHE